MIPEWKDIRKNSRKAFVINKPYFALAERFANLKKKFTPDDFIDSTFLWFDMIFYPLFILIQACMLQFSIMYGFALYKAYDLWSDWLCLRELQEEIDSWVKVVRDSGGPWISSNDPDKHVYVYADAMERILLSRVRLSKKLRKGSK
jgi:hypothetical protein